MKKIIKQVLSLTVGAFVALMMFGAQNASAVTCPAGTPGEGRGDVNSLAECSLSDTEDTLMPTLQQIINVALGVLGFVAVVVIIYGGFTYMTSNGDAAKLTKARNTIVYGVIGLIVALLAFAIVNFVLKNVFDSDSDSQNNTNNTNSSVVKPSSNSNSNASIK